jgi:hypothetical protein
MRMEPKPRKPDLSVPPPWFPKAPAYLTARFHLIRLQEELGDKAGARLQANSVLSGPLLENLPSSTNLFRGLRMLAAPDLRDFPQFALRRPVMVTFQADAGETPDFYPDRKDVTRKSGDLFDADATRLLNRRMPFRLLKQAALETFLPDMVRREALLTAFTRGLMLDEDLTEIAGRLKDADAKLAPLAAGYLAETTADARRFAGAFLLLHQPEARPYFAAGITRQSLPGELDEYRDNWWCPMDVVAAMDSRANIAWYEVPPNRLQQSADVTPEFLEGGAAADTKAELDKLGRLGAAANFLGSIVFQFAVLHPEDQRVPEALYWLVRAGHYGCVDANTWKTTHRAFRMLHLNYPKTSWAARTPTSFKNEDDIHQEMKRREQAN